MQTLQRSFRLSSATCSLLDTLAEETNESRNSLVERLLAEALRTERHPLIRFRPGAAGRREPLLVGTRVLVRQVVATVQSDGVETSAEELGLSESLVRAALAYFADFGDEIEADAAWAATIESREHARWKRAQAAMA